MLRGKRVSEPIVLHIRPIGSGTGSIAVTVIKIKLPVVVQIKVEHGNRQRSARDKCDVIRVIRIRTVDAGATQEKSETVIDATGKRTHPFHVFIRAEHITELDGIRHRYKIKFKDAGIIAQCRRSEEHTSELQSHSFISYA